MVGALRPRRDIAAGPQCLCEAGLRSARPSWQRKRQVCAAAARHWYGARLCPGQRTHYTASSRVCELRRPRREGCDPLAEAAAELRLLHGRQRRRRWQCRARRGGRTAASATLAGPQPRLRLRDGPRVRVELLRRRPLRVWRRRWQPLQGKEVEDARVADEQQQGGVRGTAAASAVPGPVDGGVRSLQGQGQQQRLLLQRSGSLRWWQLGRG